MSMVRQGSWRAIKIKIIQTKRAGWARITLNTKNAISSVFCIPKALLIAYDRYMDKLTKTAVMATLHCLTGCAIGEILGMVIGNALNWHGAATIILSIALAFFFGYLLSTFSLIRAGLKLNQAVPVALGADTVSIATMEITDNLIMLLIPGAMMAGLASGLFWGSLALSLLVAFVVTVPVNRWLISRGKGHALAHQYHSHHSQEHHH